MAAEDEVGTIWLWDLVGGRLLGRLFSGATLEGEPGEAEPTGTCAEHLSFSPDGRTLAVISGARDELQLWSVATRRLTRRLLGAGESLSKVVFGPDERTLLSVGSNFDQRRARIQLWDSSGRRRSGRALSIGGNIGQIVTSRDGRVVAFVSLAKGSAEVGKVQLWDLNSHKQIGQLPLGHGESVTSLALSPDGLTLVSVSGEDGGSEEFGGVVRLWDLATHRPLGSPLTEGGEPVQSAVFSPTSNALALLSGRGTIELWKGILWADPRELDAEVCGLVGAGLTPTEWADYVPSIPYRAVC